MSSEIVIVGGGIAGIMTAYFLLTQTNKQVYLIEAGKIAHGATGHNAGQIVSGFEKGFNNLVRSYGLGLATRAQEEVLMAWDLLQEIQAKLKLQTPIHIFTGYSGFTEKEDLLEHLENRYWLQKTGLNIQSVLISSDYPGLKTLPKRFKKLYALAPKGSILNLLQTNNEAYFAASLSKAGTTNSAHLTEEIAHYLSQNYPDRFQIFEKNPAKTIKLYKGHAEIHTTQGVQLTAKRVILCTNGFAKFTIENIIGEEVDTSIHNSIEGVVGYMSGFYENLKANPTAISYHGARELMGENKAEIPPYFYLTRRPTQTKNQNLVCLGGPEYLMADSRHYDRETHLFPKDAETGMDKFLKEHYAYAPHQIDYKFFWHGLMGYTPSGIRCVGPEPKNSVLMYNLGCNGVGILSSIAGAKRIEKYINKVYLRTSLFDPGYAIRKKQKTHLQRRVLVEKGN